MSWMSWKGILRRELKRYELKGVYVPSSGSQIPRTKMPNEVRSPLQYSMRCRTFCNPMNNEVRGDPMTQGMEN